MGFGHLFTVSKVAVFWSNAKKTNFLPENNFQKQKISFRVFFDFCVVLFCFFVNVCKHQFKTGVLLASAAQSCSFPFSYFFTDSGYSL